MAFKDILERRKVQEVITNLNSRNVPEAEFLWDRIEIYARDKDFYDSQEGKGAIAPLPSNPVETQPHELDYLFKSEEETKEDAIKVQLEKEKSVLGFDLSKDQQKAWFKIKAWVDNNDPYMIVRGFAGTGKSSMLKLLTTLPLTLYFTAPTNKATKVLGRLIGRETKTTFSQLGLRMNSDDEKLVMEYGADAPYFPRGSILVIDEASMVGKDLFEFIDTARQRSDFKVLYIGDNLQLPPVGEKTSKAWRCVDNPESLAVLKKVMRHDNQILTLATRIRERMKTKDYSFPIKDDNDGTAGVFLEHRDDFYGRIRKLDTPEHFKTNKIVCWRNKTVGKYNDYVRKQLGFTGVFDIGDIILLAEPLEIDEVIVAHIDDEFSIYDIIETEIKTSRGDYINVYSLSIENEESKHIINVPKDLSDLDELLGEKAAYARKQRGLDKVDAWKDFWSTKKQFMRVRYGYSITSHRVQGSTLENAFVDAQDILLNKDKSEAFRSLYVAITRPTTCLYTY